MFPFLVDRSWFENFWYRAPVRPKRRPFARSLARFAVCVVLVFGGVLIVGQLHGSGRVSGTHTTRTGSMME
jgi:hypothetical protein